MNKNIILFLIFIISITTTAQVGIGTKTPVASSVLEVSSETKGFLPPRMTTNQQLSINNPAEGLLLYNTDLKCIMIYSNLDWLNLCTNENTPHTNQNIAVSNITYQGVSVIDNQGIGYNGETIPQTSTITVDVSNSTATNQNYSLLARDTVSGLVYSAKGTITANTSGLSVVLTPNNVVMPPFESGLLNMPLQGASNSIALEPRIDVKSIPTSHPDWTFNEETYGAQTFMDRNLGARRKAEAIDDVFSFGNHYQWGRSADGHEITVWHGTTKTTGKGFYEVDAASPSVLSNTDTPSHNNFIRSTASPFDWRDNNNDNRWETNNQGPCPSGYHVPDEQEWDTADSEPLASGNGTNGTNTTGWDNNLETYESILKLPSSGFRSRVNGMLGSQGTFGYYWSSSINTTNSRMLRFEVDKSATGNNHRSFGFSVRCIKN